MSGNDQPPVPPHQPGSAPDDDPTPVEPPQGEQAPVEPPQGEPTLAESPQGEPAATTPPEDEPGYVMQPPPPGEAGAPTQSPKNKGLIIGAAVAAAIILIGAILFIALNAGGDDDDDKKEEAETTSVADFCKVIKEMDSSEDTADDPTVVSDALRDAGTPEGMSEDEREGRDLLIEIGDDAKDGAAAEKAVGDLSEADTAKVQAFVGYIGKACADESPSPSP